MQLSRYIHLFSFASGIVLLLAQENRVMASESTDNMTVSTPVAQASCSFGTIDPMDFGTVSGSETMVQSSAAMRVTCTNGTSYNLYANAGDNSSGNQRRLKNGTAYIDIIYMNHLAHPIRGMLAAQTS